MKKLLFAMVFACSVSALFAQAGKVEVSFIYTKQSGFASNQFAVWIEDAEGKLVKTLYATRYTANGGWQRRPLSIPIWVKQSNLAEMDKAQVDAVSGPTPRSGALKYTWDGTDSRGRALPAGEYTVYVEATLRNENQVLYTAAVKLGGESATVNAQARYSGNSAAERGMIGAVTVKY
jgi:hypothetical protein